MSDYQTELNEALKAYRDIANSHAVSPTIKTRMLTKIGMIEALARSPGITTEGPVRNKANELMEDLMCLAPVPARPNKIQLANQGDVRKRVPHDVLRKTGETYNVDAHGALANGHYCFVVPATSPWEVWVGARQNGGHTAISRGQSVYYAGEIEFENGRLVRWNNESGHYQPAAALHRQVGSLLPTEKFDAAH